MESGIGERSSFRARAGTLTLLVLASVEEPATLREMLAQLDAALYDPDFDPDDEEWVHEDEDEDEEGEGEEGEGEEGEPEPAAVALDPDVPVSLDSGDGEGDGEGDLFHVAQVLAAWLRKSPAGPLRLGEEEGALALSALVVGWSSTIVHALSGAALTFEELTEATEAVNLEALESRLESLEDACMVEPLEGAGGETRYTATRWLRQGIAPLGAAARFECRQRSTESAPPDVLDIGASFLLTLPLLELAADIAGSCRLGVRIPGEERLMAGATTRVESGRVVSIDLDLDPAPANWATGSPIGWLDTLVEPDAGKVELGGDTRLAGALVGGLHDELFADPLT